MLHISVLGPVEVRRDDERIVVPSGKTTELLVRLALVAGTPVRADRLIDDLWADAAVNTGKNTLQSKVSQLRKALRDPGLLAAGHNSYTLAIGADGVDALRVAGLAATARGLRQSGEAETAVDLAAQGLSLFRGDVLIDAGEGDWLHAHRLRLQEIRLGLLDDHLAARVELGAGGDVIGELEELVVHHPLREGFWHSLIAALYRNGRQADALAAYARVREVLRDELGLDPGSDLRDLERQILQQSVTGVSGTSTAPGQPVGNLPRLSSTLVGRDDDLSAAARAIADHRLVTLVGTAGVGKTRLAIEVARGLEVPGGSWLVRLDAIDAAAPLAQVVAEALSLSSEQLLVERLASVETVLVIDNCEHLVDAVATLVSRLLDATTTLRVLATSQLPLGIEGEHVRPVEPLPIAESVALFVSRAADMRKQFVLDDDAAASVEELCRALDGLPLAIELAAARVKSLSVQEIARRLDHRFVLLQDPTSRRPERRRALAAAIAWSYDLLFPDDQRGLWALACFTDGAPLAAVEHVLGALGVPEAAAVDVVGRLVDRSLVTLTVTDDGGVRYRLLDSVRAFAAHRLSEAELAGDALSAHAQWFAGRAEHCALTVRSPEQPAGLTFVRAERANIDAALAWCSEHDPLVGLRIANGFGWTWVVLGDGSAGASRVRAALSAADSVATHHDRAAALLLSGWLEASAGNVAQAQADLDAALGLADLLSDETLRAHGQRHLAFLHLQQGRFHDAFDRAEESLAGYRSVHLDWEQAASLLLGASAAMVLGDTARATNAANTAVRLLEPTGDLWGLVHAEAMLGAIAQAEHRFDDAARALTGAAAAAAQLGFAGQAAYHLTRLGRVEQQAGDGEAATVTLRRAIDAAVNCGDLRMAATARLNLARVLRSAGEHGAARTLAGQADTWYRTAGGGDGALLARCLVAAMSADGVAELEALLHEARHLGDAEVFVLTLDGLARFAAEHGEIAKAQQLLETADRGLPDAGPGADDVDRADAVTARAVIAAQLLRPTSAE